MKRSRTFAITIYVLQFIGMLIFAPELHAQVTQIRVKIVTPDTSGAGTDASIFLGMGGREFSLDQRNVDDFDRRTDNTLVLGQNSNAAIPRKNDPSGSLTEPTEPPQPPLTEDDVERFPVYIRMSDVGDQQDPLDFPEDEWIIESIVVTVFFFAGAVREFTSPRLGDPLVNDGKVQRLGPQSGHVLFLRQ